MTATTSRTTTLRARSTRIRRLTGLVVGLAVAMVALGSPASAAEGPPLPPIGPRATADLAVTRLDRRVASVADDTLSQMDVTVQNNGPSPTSARIAISAADPSGGHLVLQGATRTLSPTDQIAVNCAAGDGSCLLPTLVPGEQARLIVTVRWFGGPLLHALDTPTSPFHTATIRATVSSAAGVPEPPATFPFTPSNNTKTATIQIHPPLKAADLSLSNLTASASNVAHDGVVTYTMTVRNAGPLATPVKITPVTLSAFGTKAVVQSATVDGFPSSACVNPVCHLPTMSKGQSHTLGVTLKFDAPPSHTTPSVTGKDVVGVGFQVASSAVPAVPEPSALTQSNNQVQIYTSVGLEPTSADISISGLQAAETSVPHLGSVQYTMKVSNRGPLATPVRLDAALFSTAGFGTTATVVVATVDDGHVVCSDNRCPLGIVGSGQTRTVRVVVRFHGGTPPLDFGPSSAVGVMTFTIASSATPPIPESPAFGNAFDNSASTAVAVGFAPTTADLSVGGLTASSPTAPLGGTVTYTMTVKNAGPLATPVSLTVFPDPVAPYGSALESATFGGSPLTCTAGVCSLPTMSPGQTYLVTATIRFSAGSFPNPNPIPLAVRTNFRVASSATPPVPEPFGIPGPNNTVIGSTLVVPPPAG